jgi:hypothetical protein
MPGSDGDLLARLAAVARDDDPPPLVVESAKAVFGLRALDAELAELTSDSLEAAGAVRGPSEVRLLAFETPAISVDVEVTARGDRVRLMGQVATDVTDLAVDTPATTVTVPVDPLGSFLAENVPHGPVRLRFQAATGPVATSWTHL